MINNFIFGVDAVLYTLSGSLKGMAQYALFWGFAIGFLVSTVMHGFLISGGAGNASNVFLKNNIDLKDLYKINKNNGYKENFSFFQEAVREARSVFFLASILFLLIIILAIMKNS